MNTIHQSNMQKNNSKSPKSYKNVNKRSNKPHNSYVQTTQDRSTHNQFINDGNNGTSNLKTTLSNFVKGIKELLIEMISQ